MIQSKIKLDSIHFFCRLFRLVFFFLLPSSIHFFLPQLAIPDYVRGSSGFLVDAKQHVLYLQVVAGTTTGGSSGDGNFATLAKMRFDSAAVGGGVYGDSGGELFVADASNYRIRKIDSQGIITTIIGTGVGGFTGDSGAGTVISINEPYFITGDTSSSFLYFSDRYFVWKYQLSNGFLSRYGGSLPAVTGFSGDALQATTGRINSPRGLSLSAMGLLYFSDSGNNRVRVIATNGILSSFAGSGPEGGLAGSYGGDGGAASSTNCKLNNPQGVYADLAGNVFIADKNNNRIRKVGTSGIIITFAGGGAGGDGGQATDALLSTTVNDVKGDRYGNIYIAEDCKIRVIDPLGIINTIVGIGVCANSLTFSPASSSTINMAIQLWFNSDLDFYFTEIPGLVRKVMNITVSAVPSALPTWVPSSRPSNQPSSRPTCQPSAHPSRRPTNHPSVQPSSRPSGQPTRQPSSKPSSQPISLPSTQPFSGPTCQPSAHPSCQPSNHPTVQPSNRPTVQPSSRPSGQPTNHPSVQPTNHPSVQPTNHPSVQPSSRPSDQPTKQPLSQPSSRPSSLPSNQPFSEPTCRPSAHPSCQASNHPTVEPSSLPSDQPTNHPSVQPSSLPSGQPTIQPSSKPLSQPSSPPSNQPFSAPTYQPSAHPSRQPSNRPTVLPSSLPSVQLTNLQSFQPSLGLSDRPTNYPSVQPPLQPSGQRTKRPSSRPSSQLSPLPSNQPFLGPTCRLSAHPSCQPSNHPSVQPLSRPSAQPVNHPSVQPSSRPSGQHINHPSVQPSSRPSGQPTTHPSVEPSSRPSSQPVEQPSSRSSAPSSSLPSNQPLSRPTFQLSTHPSRQPSNHSTVQPSSRPSSQPTEQPSSNPSSQPTSRPRHRPSLRPSDQPSAQSSRHHTNCPSFRTSSQPSVQPSSMPLTRPSPPPSNQASSRHNCQPSSGPTPQPSSQPTGQPTNHPSAQPTMQPSAQPTDHPSSCLSSIPSVQPTTNLSSGSKRSNFPSFLVSSNPPSIRPSQIISSRPSSPFFSVYPNNADDRFKGLLFLFGIYQPSSLTAVKNIFLNKPITSNPPTGYVIFGIDKARVKANITFPFNVDLLSPTVSSYYNEISSTSSDTFLSRDSMSRASTIVGDLNGDHIVDLIVGYPYSSLCMVYLGKKDSGREKGEGRWSNLIVSFVFRGLNAGDGFGWAIDGLGDINHDGYDDIAIGAKNTGIVYILFGKVQFQVAILMSSLSEEDGYRIVGGNGLINTGMAIAGLNGHTKRGNDFNGDQQTDLVISSMIGSSSICIIYIVSLSFDGKTEDIFLGDSFKNILLRISGPSSYFVGLSLAGLGDINGDGYDDIAIGGISFQGSQRTYVIYGRASDILSSHKLDLADLHSENGFIITGGGFLVAAPGDVNNDGISDLLVLSYTDWHYSSNSYLLRYPVNVTSSPSYSPSSKPSMNISVPTSFPSIYSSLPSLTNSTSSPTRHPIVRTMKPSTHSSIPSMVSSPIVTSSPSKTRSRFPSLLPAKSPQAITDHPVSTSPFFISSSSLPTVPTSSTSTDNEDKVLITAGLYDLSSSVSTSTLQHVFIRGNGKFVVTGGKKEIIYYFQPNNHQQVEITDYNSQQQKMDFTAFSFLFSINDLSYSVNPLTFYPNGMINSETSGSNSNSNNDDQLFNVSSFTHEILHSLPTKEDKSSLNDILQQSIILSSHKSILSIHQDSLIFRSVPPRLTRDTVSNPFNLPVILSLSILVCSVGLVMVCKWWNAANGQKQHDKEKELIKQSLLIVDEAQRVPSAVSDLENLQPSGLSYPSASSSGLSYPSASSSSAGSTHSKNLPFDINPLTHSSRSSNQASSSTSSNSSVVSSSVRSSAFDSNSRNSSYDSFQEFSFSSEQPLKKERKASSLSKSKALSSMTSRNSSVSSSSANHVRRLRLQSHGLSNNKPEEGSKEGDDDDEGSDSVADDNELFDLINEFQKDAEKEMGERHKKDPKMQLR
jgi:hypothetical protein